MEHVMEEMISCLNYENDFYNLEEYQHSSSID